MQLTYLIGNGFDIGIGYNTRYVDFIRFLVKELEDDVNLATSDASNVNRSMRRWLLDQVQGHKQEFWSDAELAFGGLPFAGCDDKVADVVKFSHDVFLANMKRWLAKELERARWEMIDLDDISKRFVIWCITGWLSGATTGQLTNFLKTGEANAIELNFITFNYTDVIEKLLLPRGAAIFSFHHHDYSINVKLGSICHVHGACSDRNLDSSLVFGVNELGQIDDSAAKQDVEVGARLVKQQYQGYCDVGLVDDALRLINSSDYIVTYGLSFGATDKYWWKKLFEYVGDQRKRLVVCPYMTSDEDVQLSRDVIRYKQWAARRVFSALGENYLRQVLSTSVISQIVAVKPVEVEELNGERVLCDYLQLHSIGRVLGLRA